MTAKPKADFDEAVESFLGLLARLIARAHLRDSAERGSRQADARTPGSALPDEPVAPSP